MTVFPPRCDFSRRNTTRPRFGGSFGAGAISWPGGRPSIRKAANGFAARGRDDSEIGIFFELTPEN